MNVILVFKKSHKFSEKDVDLIVKHIHKTSHVDLYCLTSENLKSVKTIPITCDYEKWWCKTELFSPMMAKYRPFLYLDLDMAVVGSLNDIVENENHFIATEDFYQPDKLSSSMLWIPDDSDRINSVWIAWLKKKQMKGRMDYFLRKHIEPDSFWSKRIITNYKQGKEKRLKELPDGVKVVDFHGRPGIWEAAKKENWIKNYIQL